MASGFIFIAWALLLLFFVFLLFGSLGKMRGPDWLIVGTLWAFVASALAYAIVAFQLRCPSCNRRFLVESLAQKHPHARKLKGIDHWATTVIDIVKRKKFTCMYCGQEFELTR